MKVELFVPKSTGTHADPLAAIGLAHLVSPCADARIVDLGNRFRVTFDSDVDNVALQLGKDPGYRYLRPNEKAKVPEGVPLDSVLDYPVIKAAAARHRDAAKKAKKSSSDGQQEAIAADAPPDDFYQYQTLNTLQGDGATNKAFLWILRKSRAEWQRLLADALAALADGKTPQVDLEVDLVQLFDPHAAKGYARLKPDSTGRGDKTKDAWGEPFLEWLRFRGYFQAACTYGMGKDIRLLCPVPRSISLARLQMVCGALRKEIIFGTSARIDCLSVLKLAQHLVRFSESDSPTLGRRPKDYIESILITHYQSLGSAKAVTGMEELAVPGWFDNSTQEQAQLWTDTLAEHFSRLQRLRDENSDELMLLQRYRRFLEGRGDTATFGLLEFLEGYGIFVARQRGQNKWYHSQFATDHLEAILAETRYSTILESAGFKAIAGAIRSATVSAQSQKRNKHDYRDIRYDILPELRRKRLIPSGSGFIEAVTEFVSSFNSESARRLEIGKSSGIKRVTTEELADFIRLVEETKGGPALVGAMLTAYATCREVRDPELPAEDNSTETEGDSK